MTISVSISHLVILFGGGLAILLAVGQLLSPARHKGSVVFSLFLFCIGYTQILHGGVYQLLARPEPLYHIVRLISICSYFCVGPLLWIYSRIFISYNFTFTKKHLLHFLPCVVALFVWLFDMLVYGSLYEPASLLNRILAALSVVSLVSYVLVIFFYLFTFYKKILPERKAEIARPGLVLLYLIFFVCALDISNRLWQLGIKDLLKVSNSLFVVALYWLGCLYPEYSMKLRKEAKRISYESSRLSGVNVNQVLQEIDSLMANEKMYFDEDLTLARLAKELSLTPHQLSEILNVRLKKNFCSFINGFRVEEAKKLLVEEPKRSVISIASAVGFETLSAFYAAFKKNTRLSPSAYRKKST